MTPTTAPTTGPTTGPDAPTLVASAFDDLAPGLFVTDPDLLDGLAHDESSLTDRARPAGALLPRTTADVAEALVRAHRHGVPVITRGAGSGLSGGANATADSVVLSTRRMDQILQIDPVERLGVVQPGVITADLREAARAAGLFYPPDPGSVAYATIGGNVATNAGGMCCVKYGVTGDFVLGLEVVLADGTVTRTGRRTVKGVAGYDLTSLLVGSEGTLGVITEVTVRLLPAPPVPATLVATFSSLRDAGRAVAALTAAGLRLSMLELMDRTTLRAVDDLTSMGFEDDVAAMLLAQCDDGSTMLDTAAGLCTEQGAQDVAVSEDPEEGHPRGILNPGCLVDQDA